MTLAGFANRRSQEYQVTASDVFDTRVLVNGSELKLVDDQTLPDLLALARDNAETGTMTIHPLSYTFIVLPLR